MIEGFIFIYQEFGQQKFDFPEFSIDWGQQSST